MYQVYARDGWGSVLVEALLAIADERYERIDIDRTAIRPTARGLPRSIRWCSCRPS